MEKSNITAKHPLNAKHCPLMRQVFEEEFNKAFNTEIKSQRYKNKFELSYSIKIWYPFPSLMYHLGFGYTSVFPNNGNANLGEKYISTLLTIKDILLPQILEGINSSLHKYIRLRVVKSLAYGGGGHGNSGSVILNMKNIVYQTYDQQAVDFL